MVWGKNYGNNKKKIYGFIISYPLISKANIFTNVWFLILNLDRSNKIWAICKFATNEFMHAVFIIITHELGFFYYINNKFSLFEYEFSMSCRPIMLCIAITRDSYLRSNDLPIFSIIVREKIIY